MTVFCWHDGASSLGLDFSLVSETLTRHLPLSTWAVVATLAETLAGVCLAKVRTQLKHITEFRKGK